MEPDAMTSLALADPVIPEAVSPPAAAMFARVRQAVKTELCGLVDAIDREGHYPEAFMRRLGELGAYRPHLPAGPADAAPDLASTIEAMSIVSETCTSTGFMTWCQATLAWYVHNSDNAALKARFGEAVASGAQLGGTGLSNPMKTFFGIETLKLKGRRVEGGWRVKGTLPWVSNLAPANIFGTIFEVEGAPEHRVMFLADCSGEGVTIRGCEPFLAMDGTGTYAIQFRDAFIPDDHVLADPIDSYLKKIRAGFILLQSGMAVGTIRDCIAIMKEMKPQLGHVNRYLEVQPEDMEAELAALEAELAALMKTPYDLSQGYFRRVVAARLAAGEATVKAAHYAMLHAGARGYVQASRAQRRLREAYFVAIVTPATKQLRKMLADMGPVAAH
jgi:hypothetical protein